MTLTTNSATYNDLLIEFSPKVIDSETEYERALSIVERLLFNKNRTEEETAIYLLLVTLIESYEAKHHPIPKPSPDSILRHLLEASGTRPSDLFGVIGTKDEVLDIISGNQAVNEAQSNILAARFKVSPGLFQSYCKPQNT